MPDVSLASAIASSLSTQMDRTSDRILRVEASRDWPIATAMHKYAEAHDEVRFLIRRPFTAAPFSPLKVTDSAAIATRWRNERRRTYDIVIIGATGGSLDAGLRDVRRVDRRKLITAWQAAVLGQLPEPPSELSKPEFRRLLEELFEMVANGSVQASGLERYIASVLRHANVATICNSLWMLGLLPDARALDVGVARRRIQRNLDVVTQLRTSDDARIERHLEAASASTNEGKRRSADGAQQYRETGNNEELKPVQLPDLEEIFAPESTTAGPRATNLFDLLDRYTEHPADVVASLRALAEHWDCEVIQEALETTLTLEGKECLVRVELHPAQRDVPIAGDDDPTTTLDYPWTHLLAGEQILAATSSATDPEPLNAGQRLFRGSALQNMGYSHSAVEKFLESRRALGKYEPWLDKDSVALFLLNDQALAAAEEYLRTWSDLVEAAIGHPDARALIEAMQVLETVSGPGDNAEWVLLGPLHPYRVDPAVRAVKQCRSYISGQHNVQKVGSALEWTLDRSYPAYPTIHRRDRTLYTTSSSVGVVYCKTVAAHMPAVREAGGCGRILAAIERFSPWLADGVALLVIDPPPGGGVAKCLEGMRRRVPGRPIRVYHLATHDYTDPLDGFDGEIRYLPKVGSLAAAGNLPPVNIVIRFASAASASGEPYAVDWRATKGSHLALCIEESLDGPFATRPTTKIKVDPREGNVVVRLVHQLYKAITGGRPIHAILRPLLETDDAPSLSKMAANTDWIIFGAPGPLGLVAPRTINNTLRYVGRAGMGCYGLYAYVADEMFPVRKHFEDFFQRTPMASVSAGRMVDLLVRKAQESSDAVLFASLSRVPAQIGALNAVHIAKQNADDSDITFVVSLDELGWTRVWLNKDDGVRADFLVVTIRPDESVRFQVVESKSEESGNKLDCSSTVRQFAEAIDQVDRTIRALDEITTAAEPSLDQDLRYTSLIEQLMAASMASASELGNSRRKRAIAAINKLSRREATPAVSGLVVLTQAGINAPRETKRANDRISMVWSGNPDVEQAFELPRGFVMTTRGAEEPSALEPSATATEGLKKVSDQRRPMNAAPDQESESATAPEADVSRCPRDGEVPAGNVHRLAAGSEVADAARAFIAAARIHGVPVSENEPVFLHAGPTVFVAGVRLREGAKVRDLQSRLRDIARDAGFGERADLIEVENDSEPRTVRVVMPRPDREFPELPSSGLPVLTPSGSYLPLLVGQTFDGRDRESSVEAWPHMLIAGTSGSGKTTFVKTLLLQCSRHGSGRLQTIVVDGKGETDYFGILPQEMFPERFPEIQLGCDAAIEALRWTVEEMEERRKRIVELARRTPSPQPLKASDLYRLAIEEKRVPEVVPLLVIIDEFADIMIGNRRDADEFESLVQRVAQVGRSKLVHIVLATQRPDRETVRGAIKANLNCRAVFRLPTQADSVTVLGHAGAEKLLFHGDMLFKCGTSTAERLQGYRV